MLRFCGFELELSIERIVAQQDGPASCWATDSSGDNWLVGQMDDSPDHLTWLWTPVSARALLDHGRAVPDRCLLGASLPARRSGEADRAAAWAA
jgi:hypothetical protein